MFIKFKDKDLGEVRIALDAIKFYYKLNEAVLIESVNLTLTSYEHTIEELDLAIIECYKTIKDIPSKAKDRDSISSLVMN